MHTASLAILLELLNSHAFTSGTNFINLLQKIQYFFCLDGFFIHYDFVLIVFMNLKI